MTRFLPLEAIYRDQHPHLVIIKPAQRGISEYAVNLTTFALDQGAGAWAPWKNGLNVAYIFPNANVMADFSKERVAGLKREHPYLNALFTDDDYEAVGFKQVRDSYLYLRGGWSETALLAFAADVLILDEFDRMDRKAIALARRRLNASEVKREVDISTPTLPGQGIDAEYLLSDQRIYEQPCPSCGEWTSYDFLRDVRVAGARWEDWQFWDAPTIQAGPVTLHCPVCGAVIDDAARCAPGRWRAQEPGNTSRHGYRLPQLAYPMVNLTTFAITAISQDPSEIQEFYRSDLGVPYEVGGSRVTLEMLGRLSHRLPNGLPIPQGYYHTTMGVDTGSRFHFRISATGSDGERYIRAAGYARGFADLDTLMAEYQVQQCVIDALPEQHATREWAGKYQGRVLRAYYPQENALQGQLYRIPDGDNPDHRIQINRTMAMDRVYASIAKASANWPAAIANDPVVRAHLTAPVRVVVTDDQGQEKASWAHIGPDHYYHACFVAGTLVQTGAGERPIETLQPGDLVWTRQGLRPVLAAAMTDPDAEVREYRFSNGASLTGTSNHPIYTRNRGFIPLRDTVYGDILYPWETLKSSTTAAQPGGAIPTASGEQIGSISSRREAGRPGWVGSIRKSGRTTTALFRQGMKSIIGTGTRSITPWTTWSLSRKPTTAQSTPDVRSWRTTSAMSAGNPSGRERPAEQNGEPVATPAMPRSGGLADWMTRTEPALSAERPSGSTAIRTPSPAPVPAPTSASVRLSGASPRFRAPVYNLTVAGQPEYFANGLLVHNCVYDEVAYATIPATVDPGILMGKVRVFAGRDRRR